MTREAREPRRTKLRVPTGELRFPDQIFQRRLSFFGTAAHASRGFDVDARRVLIAARRGSIERFALFVEQQATSTTR